jgi:hypothetical protein
VSPQTSLGRVAALAGAKRPAETADETELPPPPPPSLRADAGAAPEIAGAAAQAWDAGVGERTLEDEFDAYFAGMFP